MPRLYRQMPKGFPTAFEDGSSEDRPAWHSKVYAGSDGTMGKRRYPSVATRKKTLERQHNRCLYCDNTFGNLVRRKGEFVFVVLNWDHRAPFSYLQANPSNNWVAACSACNQIKSGMMFDSLEETRKHILQRRREKGYEDVSG